MRGTPRSAEGGCRRQIRNTQDICSSLRRHLARARHRNTRRLADALWIAGAYLHNMADLCILGDYICVAVQLTSRSDSLGRQQNEYVESWLNNAGNKRGWSGSQVRLTRLELTIYRTEHFRPLAPNPSTSPRAAPRDLGRSRAISGDLGAAPRYLGRSRSVARAASHLLKKRKGPVGATGLTRTCSLGSRRLALRHLGR